MKHLAFNPYLPSFEYVPDGEPRVYGGRLYIYGSHDLFNGAEFCLGDYVCWYAPLDDLGDWRYEGVLYRKEQDPKNPKGKMHMCAPDCVRGADGRYYLYYQLHALKCTSVAVADSPTGPFAFYGYVQHPDGTPWGDRKGDSLAFDPGVLVDEDGRVYLYVGFSPVGLFKTVFSLRGNRVEEAVRLELEADMKTVKGGEKPILPGHDLAKGSPYEGHGFYEASSLRKIGDTFFTQGGADREENGDQYIANVKDGAWAGFKFFCFDGSENRITVSIRGTAAGTLHVYADRSMPSVAAVSICPSDNWVTCSASLSIPAGTAPLYFAYEGSGYLDFKDFTIT